MLIYLGYHFLLPFLILHHFLLISLDHSAAAAAKVPALIVFGDSTVDSGNNNYVQTVLKSNFKPYGRDFTGGRATGRFCNGRLATDFISEALGLSPTVPAYLDPAYGIKDFVRGVCFASAGTGLDNATSGVLGVIPLWKEVEYFKEYRKKLRRFVGRGKASYILREAIYIVSIGTNDFLENYYMYVTGRFNQFTVAEFQDFLVALAADFLLQIYELGARKISFSGLCPMGCLPLERTMNFIDAGECIEEYNKVSRDFNAKLKIMIARLCASLPGMKLRYSQTYDGFVHIFRNPSAYGLENVSEGCCATGMFEMGYLCNEYNPQTCKDADKYLFWDAFHPTEKINRFMAESALNSSLAEFL